MAEYGSQTRTALQNHKLAPKKRFGQNFLVHRQTAEAIVRAAGVGSEDLVVEVGVGLGALTAPLAAAARQVIGYEIDSGIIRLHQEEGRLADNVSLRHQDILKVDFAELAGECGGPLQIVANLPYSISNPFLFKLIDNAASVATATVMLQKEVAERLTAATGSKEYGVPTVLLASCAVVRTLMRLSPAEFHPRPKVDSLVVQVDFRGGFHPGLAASPGGYPLLRRVVRTCFNQRRKTILNTLCDLLPASTERADRRQLVIEAIAMAGLQPARRPETLELIDFLRLCNSLAEVAEMVPER